MVCRDRNTAPGSSCCVCDCTRMPEAVVYDRRSLVVCEFYARRRCPAGVSQQCVVDLHHRVRIEHRCPLDDRMVVPQVGDVAPQAVVKVHSPALCVVLIRPRCWLATVPRAGPGSVAERTIAPVSKTGCRRESARGFESHRFLKSTGTVTGSGSRWR